MKKIVVLLLMMLTAVSYAQQPRPKFSTGSRNLNFGNVVVGKTNQLFTQFRVDSTATAAVTVMCTYPRNPQYSIIGDTQFTIEIGGIHNFTVEYSPSALGQIRDTLFFTHNGDTTSVKTPSTINLNGTGVASDTFARMGIQSGFFQFGSVEVGKSAQRSFRIQNTTDTIRQLNGTIAPLKPPFSLVPGGSPFSLASYDTIRVFIDFTPTAVGAFFDSVMITSNADSANSIRKVYFTATGTPPGSDTLPRMTVTGTGGGGGGGVNFGNLTSGASATRYITIRNSSIVNKPVLVTVGLPTMSVFTVDSGGGSLTIDSGMSAMVKLRFSPTAAGSYRDSLYLTSNAIEPNNNVKVILRGEVAVNDVKELPTSVTAISLYPNPAKDYVTSRITLSEPTTISISVFDTKGVEVLSIPTAHYQVGIPDVDFSVKSFPSGIYNVRYSFLNSVVSILMVIER